MAESKKKYFTVDARALLTLGRDSIKDHITAVLELVKNSYDADADRVDVEILSQAKTPTIRITDNGVGMSEADIDESWLRIGFSAKRKKKTTRRRRRKTGEKGVGRLSADRLGASLTLRTKTRSSSSVELEVNWDAFNVSGQDLQAVPLAFGSPEKLSLPQRSDGTEATSGTELLIGQLRQTWPLADLEELADELSVLTPPFRDVKDFSVHLESDVPGAPSGLVESRLLETAELRLRATFDGTKAKYEIFERNEVRPTRESEVPWAQIVQHAGRRLALKKVEPAIGQVDVEFLFYPRKPSLVLGTPFSLSDLREFLDRNSGVRIYRDLIRVRPYGEALRPEGDWLGLAERKSREPAGAGRPTFRVSASQLVGAVFLTRDGNPALIDSSSREGLVHTDEYFQLRAVALGCLTLLEAYYHERFVEGAPLEVPQPRENVRILRDELHELEGSLKAISREVPRTHRSGLRSALAQVEAVEKHIGYTYRSLSELISQAAVFRGLATVGIAATVFAHETQSAIDQILSSLTAGKLLLSPSKQEVESTLQEIEKAIQHAEQVASWGSFALARVRRDKRRRRTVSVTKLLTGIVEGLKPPFKSAGITLDDSGISDSVEARTFPMDVESVTVNLLTNAYTACQHGARERRVRIQLDKARLQGRKAFRITVGDSGPGVAKELEDRIWEPLFSTKVGRPGAPAGTGLGLAIVQSVIEELGGSRELGRDPELKGARFSVVLPGH